MRYLQQIILLAAIAVPLAVGLVFEATAQGSVSDRSIANAAKDIGRGIDEARLSAVPSDGAFSSLTIKVATYAPPANVSREIGASVNVASIQLTTAMQNKYGERYRFVSDTARNALIDDIAAEIIDESERNRVLSDIEANSRPDILIRSIVVNAETDPKLIYQAISVRTAEILATSTPIVLPAEDRVIVISDHNTETPPSGSDGIFRPIALEAENLLLEHGYDPGRVDGYIDDDLRDSLRDYQADSALEVNGRLTWETVENLRRDLR